MVAVVAVAAVAVEVVAASDARLSFGVGDDVDDDVDDDDDGDDDDGDDVVDDVDGDGDDGDDDDVVDDDDGDDDDDDDDGGDDNDHGGDDDYNDEDDVVDDDDGDDDDDDDVVDGDDCNDDDGDDDDDDVVCCCVRVFTLAANRLYAIVRKHVQFTRFKFDKPRPFTALKAIKNEMMNEFDIEDAQWDLQLGQIANLWVEYRIRLIATEEAATEAEVETLTTDLFMSMVDVKECCQDETQIEELMPMVVHVSTVTASTMSTVAEQRDAVMWLEANCETNRGVMALIHWPSGIKVMEQAKKRIEDDAEERSVLDVVEGGVGRLKEALNSLKGTVFVDPTAEGTFKFDETKLPGVSPFCKVVAKEVAACRGYWDRASKGLKATLRAEMERVGNLCNGTWDLLTPETTAHVIALHDGALHELMGITCLVPAGELPSNDLVEAATAARIQVQERMQWMLDLSGTLGVYAAFITGDVLNEAAPPFVTDLFLTLEICCFGLEGRLALSQGALLLRQNKSAEGLLAFLQAAQKLDHADKTSREVFQDEGGKEDHIVRIIADLSKVTATNRLAFSQAKECIEGCRADVRTAFHSALLRSLVPEEERAMIWPPVLSEAETMKKAYDSQPPENLSTAIKVAEIGGHQEEARAMSVLSRIDNIQRALVCYYSQSAQAVALSSLAAADVVFETRTWDSFVEVDQAVRVLKSYDIPSQLADKVFKEQISQAKEQLDKVPSFEF